MNQNISIENRAQIFKLIDFLEKNYSNNLDMWSTMLIPKTSDEKYCFYSYTTNGAEQLNRSLNRHIRDYHKENVGIVGKYCHAFLSDQIQTIELMKINDKSLDISKLMKVKLVD